MQENDMKKRGFGPWIKNFCKKKPIGAIGLAFLLVLILIAIFADVLAPVKMTAGMFTRSAPMIMPGTTLSQVDKSTMPSSMFSSASISTSLLTRSRAGRV